MTPHVCPVCQGRGKVPAPPGFDQCPACDGACVLWEPQPATRPNCEHHWDLPTTAGRHCIKCGIAERYA